MLVLAVHFWWATFGLATRATWEFDSFSVVLLQAVMMFMGSTLIFPRMQAGEPTDLRTHYFREARPFFAFGLLFLAFGFLKDWLLDGRIASNAAALAFFSYFTLLTLAALVFRRPRVHEFIAPAMAAGVLLFIALMFFRLGPGQ
jgi:hypothetical protein